MANRSYCQSLHFLIKTKLVSRTLRTVVVQLLYFSHVFRVTNAHFVREFKVIPLK